MVELQAMGGDRPVLPESPVEPTGARRPEFVSEAITPVEGSFSTSFMSSGEPGLPSRFLWRGTQYEVARVLGTWKTTGPCRHGSGEQYVRKHFFRLETTDGTEMEIYFDRNPRSRQAKQRWWIASVVEKMEPRRGSDEPVISTASVEDAEEILVLQKLAYESEAIAYGDWSLPPLTQTLEELREQFETNVILKATIGDRLVGSVRAKVTAGVCRIGRLIVHPDFQGQGIGSRLLQAIESSFPDTAMFELFTGSKSEATIRLYERHGYVRTRTEQQSVAVRIVYLEKPAGGPA